jgi:hypothetical protein
VYPCFVDVWSERGVATEVVELFNAEEFTEFTFAWPQEHQMPVFDHFVHEVMPSLCGDPSSRESH